MLKKALLLTLICLAALRVPAAGQTAARWYEMALQKSAEGKTYMALEYIDKAIAADTANAEYFVARGYLLFNAGKVPEAQAWLNKAVKKFPRYAEAYLYRGAIGLIIGDKKTAVADNTKALPLAGNDSLRFLILANRANAYYALREYEKALADYQSALKLKPGNVHIVVSGMGSTYRGLKQYDKSIEWHRKARALFPQDISVLENIGFTYIEAEKYDLALSYLDSAIVLQGKNPSPLVLNNKGFTLFKLGKSKEGLELVDQSLELMPDNSYAWKNRALILLSLNRKTEACAALDNALKAGFTENFGPEAATLKSQYCAPPKAPAKGPAKTPAKKTPVKR